MGKKADHENESKAALDSAVKVIRAIKSLDIPPAHKRRYVDRAVWHVTVPQESMKYRTRFVSIDAQDVLEKMNLISGYRHAVTVACKTANRIPNLAAKVASLDDETRRSLGAFPSQSHHATQQEYLRLLKDEKKRFLSSLRHEHVMARRELIKSLLDPSADVRSILSNALTCTVTKDEHQRLEAVSKEVQGKNRYKVAKVRVFDTKLQQLAPWGAT